MLKIGLTGGIGCGKSRAVAVFRQLGVPIVDADQIARQVVQPGEPSLALIAQQFGTKALTEQGDLNRPWLRERIFTESTARQQLEAILHPAIRARLLRQLEHYAQDSAVAYVIVDIPLLVEQGYQSLFDRIIVVDCLPEQQIQRVQARDGSDLEQINGIIAAQAGRAERLRFATDVLDNTSSTEWLDAQVRQLHQQLLILP